MQLSDIKGSEQLTTKELSAVSDYVAPPYSKDLLIGVSDKRDEYKEYYLKIDEETFVYFKNDYVNHHLVSEYIEYKDLTNTDLEIAEETFELKDSGISDERAIQLSIELKFRNGH